MFVLIIFQDPYPIPVAGIDQSAKAAAKRYSTST
jgi:hypothetical protein